MTTERGGKPMERRMKKKAVGMQVALYSVCLVAALVLVVDGFSSHRYVMVAAGASTAFGATEALRRTWRKLARR
jgi:hypothetical protein